MNRDPNFLHWLAWALTLTLIFWACVVAGWQIWEFANWASDQNFAD